MQIRLDWSNQKGGYNFLPPSNSGTFPLQSERFYQASTGWGPGFDGAFCPLRIHGYRARESVLHCLWKMEQWLQRHLGDATA
ncbi:hypothetical protein JST97_38595 [bacterium]|nr:hypothetical protein [bacterium]